MGGNGREEVLIAKICGLNAAKRFYLHSVEVQVPPKSLEGWTKFENCEHILSGKTKQA